MKKIVVSVALLCSLFVNGQHVTTSAHVTTSPHVSMSSHVTSTPHVTTSPHVSSPHISSSPTSPVHESTPHVSSSHPAVHTQEHSPDVESAPKGRVYNAKVNIPEDEIHQYPGRTYFYYLLENNHTKQCDTIVGKTPADVREEVERITSNVNENAKRSIIVSFLAIVLGGALVYYGFKYIFKE